MIAVYLDVVVRFQGLHVQLQVVAALVVVDPTIDVPHNRGGLILSAALDSKPERPVFHPTDGRCVGLRLGVSLFLQKGGNRRRVG